MQLDAPSRGRTNSIVIALVVPHASPDPGMGLGDIVPVVAGLAVLALAAYFAWLHVRLVHAVEKIAAVQERQQRLTDEVTRKPSSSAVRDMLGVLVVLIGIGIGVACDPCAAVAQQAGNSAGPTCTLSCSDLRCDDGSSALVGPSGAYCPNGAAPICAG